MFPAVRRYHGIKRKAFGVKWRTLLDRTASKFRRLSELSATEFFWYLLDGVMTPTPTHSRAHSRSESFGDIKYQPLNAIQSSNLVVTVTRVGRSNACQLLWNTIKSAIPYLMFLALYGANDLLHVLPRYDDIACITLNNVSALEYRVLHFSPHKFISSHHHTILDILAAIPYLCHYGLPVVYPLYLLVKGRTDDIQRFYWLLGWIMWFQYFIWFVFPTAPPWFYDNMQYYSQSGIDIPPLREQHKEGCAFGRLDQLTGLHFFFKMFAGNPVPFGAFPSGHVAWPTTIFMIRPPGGRIFALYVMWVAWATLYSCHHYLTDAMGAVLLVVGVKRLLIAVKDKTMTSLGSERTLPSLAGESRGDGSLAALAHWLCMPCQKIGSSNNSIGAMRRGSGENTDSVV